MAFNADKVVEALDYDFRPYVEAHGTIVEPTDDQVRAMNVGLREATVKLTGKDFDPTDRREVARIFGGLSDDQLKGMEVANVEAVTIVTGTNPSADDIGRLPFRIKRQFIKWLIKELNDPEGAATDTKP